MTTKQTKATQLPIPPQKLDNHAVVVEIEGDTKIEKFIKLLGVCKTIREAARKAGYSEATSTSYVYTLLKNPKFQERLQSYYNSNSVALLPKIARLERKVVDIVLKDPEKLPKHRHTLREVKQAAGVLRPDNQEQGPVTVNINKLQMLLRSGPGGD